MLLRSVVPLLRRCVIVSRIGDVKGHQHSPHIASTLTAGKVAQVAGYD